jgi:hypothetical protein
MLHRPLGRHDDQHHGEQDEPKTTRRRFRGAAHWGGWLGIHQGANGGYFLRYVGEKKGFGEFRKFHRWSAPSCAKQLRVVTRVRPPNFRLGLSLQITWEDENRSFTRLHGGVGITE